MKENEIDVAAAEDNAFLLERTKPKPPKVYVDNCRHCGERNEITL